MKVTGVCRDACSRAPVQSLIQYKRGWAEYAIYIDKITCLRESTVDGGTSDDEPFFFAGLSSYGLNTPEFQNYGPFSNIGTDGNDRSIIEDDRRFRKVKLPHGGSMILVLEAHESDKEKVRDRSALYAEFRGAISQSDMDDYPQVVAEFGRTFGADWKVSGLRVYAFQRGDTPKFGRVLKVFAPFWINGDDSLAFRLDQSSAKSLGVNLADLSNGSSLFPGETAKGFSVPLDILTYEPGQVSPKSVVKEPKAKMPKVKRGSPLLKDQKKN